MAIKLLDLFVEIKSKGLRELDRDLARIEKRAAAAEKAANIDVDWTEQAKANGQLHHACGGGGLRRLGRRSGRFG